MSKLILRTTLLAALAATAAYMPACSSSSDSAQASDSLTSGVVFEGGATSSTLIQILQTESDSWGWAGGAFLTPKPDSALAATAAVSVPAAKPYTFSWHSDQTDVFPEAGAAGALSIQSSGGYTGMAYLLVFSTPDNARLLRVYTTGSSFTPSAAAWQSLVKATGPVTLTLTTATFENDALTVDGGPHGGQQLTLSFDGS